jgi:hypothetical protein
MSKSPWLVRIQRLNKPLASIKIAVLVIIGLAVITAYGTFVEAELDAASAQKLVYHSKWMYGLMALLSVNLIAVMVDRWPWRLHHTGFVFAHIGILILLGGSLLTRYWGVDGSMTLKPGAEAVNRVMVAQTDLTVYTSFDGSRYTKLFDQPVDFFLDSPKDDPIVVDLPSGQMKVVDYIPFAFRDSKIVESERSADGSAVRFQLENQNVNLTEWLLQTAKGRPAEKDLGPALVVLSSEPYLAPEGRNVLVLRPNRQDPELIEFEVHTARTGEVKKGKARAGDAVQTGWMDMTLRILKVMPKAREEISFIAHHRPTPLTTSAVKIEYNGEVQWAALNSLLKLFSDQSVYVVMYANRQIPIGFDLSLKDFRIGRYQGTIRAASYESLVTVPDRGEVLISMNEPLKHNGFTFYQASFTSDEQTGEPNASILSVNWDPGRWVKYLGSLLIVLGSIHMFYFRKRQMQRARGGAA